MTKKATRRNTFTKMGGSTFNCATCTRRTRHTGAQSLGCDLCPQCFELAGIENELSDGNATIDERRTMIEALITDIEAKGGTPREEFAGLLQRIAKADVDAGRGPQTATATDVAQAEPIAVTVNRNGIEVRIPGVAGFVLTFAQAVALAEQLNIALDDPLDA